MSQEITEFDALLESDTLRGDLRDAILAEFKHIEGPWSKAPEGEQERLIRRAEDIAGSLVRGAIDLIAAKGLPALPITVGKITVEGAACKGVFECYADDDNLLRIRHLQGSRAMFVLASPDRFNGEQKEAETENIGDLALPKGDERADQANLDQVVRGKAA